MLEITRWLNCKRYWTVENFAMYSILPNFALLLLAATLCTACASEQSSVTLAGHSYSVAIADDTAEQTRGLMFVEQMPEDHGMLFIFPDSQPRSFWMRNTLIPLDIIYFDADLRLVSISKNARPCKTSRCDHYPSSGPAKYVLELNAGHADQLGLQVGDVLTLQLR